MAAPASSFIISSSSSGGGSSAVEQAQELKDQGNDFFRKVCYFIVNILFVLLAVGVKFETEL